MLSHSRSLFFCFLHMSHYRVRTWSLWLFWSDVWGDAWIMAITGEIWKFSFKFTRNPIIPVKSWKYEYLESICLMTKFPWHHHILTGDWDGETCHPELQTNTIAGTQQGMDSSAHSLRYNMVNKTYYLAPYLGPLGAYLMPQWPI